MSYNHRYLEFLFVHHHGADNIGDRECSVWRHIRFPNHAVSNFRAKLPRAETIIIGGGAVLGDLKRMASNGLLSRYRRAIIWGIGLGPAEKCRDDVDRLTSSCTAIGSRDYNWRNHIAFVPCASCLSSHFDDLPSPKHDVILYLHRRKLVSDSIATSDFVRSYNTGRDLRATLEYLASGKTVVTNSYHGVYWSQLIGRRVVCLPYGYKFSTFQDRPTMATEDSWLEATKSATAHPSRLHEYREININFMNRALDLAS